MRNDFFGSAGYCFNVHLSICNLDVRPREATGWPFYCCLYDTQVLASSRLQLSRLVSHFHQILSRMWCFFPNPLCKETSWCSSSEVRLFIFSFAVNWNGKFNPSLWDCHLPMHIPETVSRGAQYSIICSTAIIINQVQCILAEIGRRYQF